LVYPPALKIGPRARGAALAVCGHVDKDDYVLASSSVSEQVSTLRKCGHPLLTEPRWLLAPQEEIERRAALVRYISVAGADVPVARAQWFLDSLALYQPKVIVTLEDALKNQRMKVLLRWAGYEKADQVEGNVLWMRVSAFRKTEQDRVAADLCK